MDEVDEPVLEFPQRLYTKDNEPMADKSIGYYSSDPSKLLSVLSEVLQQEERDVLFNSRLGVFLKFHDMDFGWASRLVHYLLTLQLQCKKKYEIWCLIGAQPIRFSLHEFERITELNCEWVEDLDNPDCAETEEMTAFWELLGVPTDMGPSVEDLLAACGVCHAWTRDNRIRLGYLAIFAIFIVGRRPSKRTPVNLARLVMDLKAFNDYPWGRVAFRNLIESVKSISLESSAYHIKGFVQVLQCWAYFALPDFGSEFGDPIVGKPTPFLLSHGGSRYRKNLLENLKKQTNVINCVLCKDFDEMVDLWDDDGADPFVDNTIKALLGMFPPKPWKWKISHWKVQGVETYMHKESGSKRSNVPAEEPPVSKRQHAASSSHVGGNEDTIIAAMKAHMDEYCKQIVAQVMDHISSGEQHMVKGLDRCEKQMQTLADRLITVEETLAEMKSLSKEQVKSNADVEAEKTTKDNDPAVGVSKKPIPKTKRGKSKK